ncbi:hypothetical protein BU25DRAFT_436317 [Macroventuria anomochaeta]|uniref:Uncharacterized protein n=1 Tax=Macroventuria anomochaeta TaxID=301207 RepID=A0ACB6SHD8_9PLEO|nr:uncharacterized protein BU25DRAFT_436317 [Macroventuria anomochaeta]KAF2632512.1 hypothetical protein BU25DRAFT_436317 [Macroventuria anomochaeta]
MDKTAKLIDLENLKRRAQQKVALKPLTSEDIKGLLIRFSEHVLQKPMLEKQFTEAPTIYQIKLFLEYFARARDGLLEDQITDTTLINRFNNLKQLVPGGLVSTCARPKPNAPIPVASDIVRFLFASDEYKEFHPRIRVQMAFTIQLMSCVGSIEGLLYKDVDLLYFSEPEPGWRLHVKLRNRKEHREYKKHAYVVVVFLLTATDAG